MTLEMKDKKSLDERCKIAITLADWIINLLHHLIMFKILSGCYLFKYPLKKHK